MQPLTQALTRTGKEEARGGRSVQHLTHPHGNAAFRMRDAAELKIDLMTSPTRINYAA